MATNARQIQTTRTGEKTLQVDRKTLAAQSKMRA